MKRSISNQLVWVLCSVILFSCAKNNLTIRVTEPAPVTINPMEKVVVVLNRSASPQKNAVLDGIEKILTLEGMKLDLEGAKMATSGLDGELRQNRQFEKVIEDENMKVDNPGMGIFPAPLDAASLNQIADVNNAGLLFTLAFYDTDTKAEYKLIPSEINTGVGVNIPVSEHLATISTTIKTGWRIYDLRNHRILDEYIMTRIVTASGKGITPIEAVKAAMARKELVLTESSRMGGSYALRVVPSYRRVSREYFVRGSNKFKMGKRRAQTGDWDGAAELWKEEVSNQKSKIAGRAHYNMAISSEINGELDEAIDWASKAYTDYKIKIALNYINVLKSRKRKNELLEQQRGEK